MSDYGGRLGYLRARSIVLMMTVGSKTCFMNYTGQLLSLLLKAFRADRIASPPCIWKMMLLAFLGGCCIHRKPDDWKWLKGLL